jgi:hypothetical protein
MLFTCQIRHTQLVLALDMLKLGLEGLRPGSWECHTLAANAGTQVPSSLVLEGVDCRVVARCTAVADKGSELSRP